MKKFWLPLLLCLLFCACCAAAQARDITIDALDGPDLAERLAAIEYTGADTLRLYGQFHTWEAVFPERARVVLESATVHGVLVFPKGGTLTGLWEDRMPQIFGGVRAEEDFTVTSVLAIHGYLHLGNAWSWDLPEAPPPRDVTLSIEGTLHVMTSDDVCSLYSIGDIAVADNAHLLVTSTFRDGNVAVANNLRLGEGAAMEVSTEARAPAVLVRQSLELGDTADLSASAGMDGCALSARSVLLGDYAGLRVEAKSCHGVGLRAFRLETGPNATIEAQALHGGIVLQGYADALDFDRFSDIPTASLGEHLRLDPSTVLDTPILLFNGNFAFTAPLVFTYPTPEPPLLCLEDTGFQVTGYAEYYRPAPVPVDPDDDGGACCPPPPVDWREWWGVDE